MQSLIPYPSTFKDGELIFAPMAENAIVRFCAFSKKAREFGIDCGVVCGSKCGGVHDEEKIEYFYDKVNKFFSFFLFIFLSRKH